MSTSSPSALTVFKAVWRDAHDTVAPNAISVKAYSRISSFVPVVAFVFPWSEVREYARAYEARLPRPRSSYRDPSPLSGRQSNERNPVSTPARHCVSNLPRLDHVHEPCQRSIASRMGSLHTGAGNRLSAALLTRRGIGSNPHYPRCAVMVGLMYSTNAKPALRKAHEDGSGAFA